TCGVQSSSTFQWTTTTRSSPVLREKQEQKEKDERRGRKCSKKSKSGRTFIEIARNSLRQGRWLAAGRMRDRRRSCVRVRRNRGRRGAGRRRPRPQPEASLCRFASNFTARHKDDLYHLELANRVP